MKRKMELIRAILEFAEETIKPGRRNSGYEPKIEGYDRDDIDYHVKLCVQAGYIDAASKPYGGSLIRELTWSGHDALAARGRSLFTEPCYSDSFAMSD